MPDSMQTHPAAPHDPAALARDGTSRYAAGHPAGPFSFR